jgi:hypothetical protein
MAFRHLFSYDDCISKASRNAIALNNSIPAKSNMRLRQALAFERSPNILNINENVEITLPTKAITTKITKKVITNV